MELNPTVWLIGILAGTLLLTVVFHARRQSRLRREMDDQYWSKVKERKLQREMKRRTEALGKLQGNSNSQDQELLNRLQKVSTSFHSHAASGVMSLTVLFLR